jgi:CubicO group peptidase (beta-lactamase class C family)
MLGTTNFMRITFLALSTLPSLSFARPLTPAAVDSLRATIGRSMAAGHVPSLAVAVAQHGRIVWEEGFGLADVERRIPATARTLYSIASISKPLTATALMTLVERGKVDLDRPANDYLGTPGIHAPTGEAAAATVRQVLSHTAGLPPYVRYFFENDSTSRADTDRAIARCAVTVYPPGRVYDYSNLGYGLVQRIIEKASGRRYEDYMRTEVFVPLGMETTTIGTGAGLANAAVRYSSQGAPLPFYDTDHRGASGVYTSAHELARFAMFQLRDHVAGQKRILADRTIEAMQRVATPGDSTQGYGLGFDVGREGPRKFVMHNGGMPGVDVTMRMFPAEDVAIVVLTNSESGAASEVADAIHDAVLGREEGTPAGPPETFQAPAALQGQWQGTVRTFDGTLIPLALRVKADDVHVRLGGPGTFTTVLNQPRYIAGIRVLTGVLAGSIPTEDTRDRPHFVLLTLWFDGERLRGHASAVLTGGRAQESLPAAAELTRSPTPP